MPHFTFETPSSIFGVSPIRNWGVKSNLFAPGFNRGILLDAKAGMKYTYTRLNNCEWDVFINGKPVAYLWRAGGNKFGIHTLDLPMSYISSGHRTIKDALRAFEKKYPLPKPIPPRSAR